VTVLDFGCRLNLAEGYRIRALGLPDDVTVINSCAVTGEAVRQAMQAVRRVARAQPDARIVVTGCAATLEPARFAALPGVARVVANDAKLARAAYPDATALSDATRRVPTAERRHSRAFVAVQTGCDHACTFCIIHRARGPARSEPVAAVIDRVRALVDAGIREVVLTGVDLTSFRPGLGALVQRILHDAPALPRLRLSSLDMVEIDDALLDAIADPRLMPQLHLSLQSGDAIILKRMARRHSPAAAVALCAALRARRPDLHLAADLIAGFPTETEAMFAATLRHVADCGLSQLHVFPYSPRDGTPAARMPQLPVEVRRARARQLRALGAARLDDAMRAQLGHRQRVLVEGDGTTGYTEHYLPARLPAGPRPATPRGQIADVVALAVVDGRLECA